MQSSDEKEILRHTDLFKTRNLHFLSPSSPHFRHLLKVYQMVETDLMLQNKEDAATCEYIVERLKSEKNEDVYDFILASGMPDLLNFCDETAAKHQNLTVLSNRDLML